MTLSDSSALREFDQPSSIEKGAMDAVTRAERSLAHDPLRQMERFLASDPARQMERQVRELERMQGPLGLKRHIEAATRTERILGCDAVQQAERHREFARTQEMLGLKHPIDAAARAEQLLGSGVVGQMERHREMERMQPPLEIRPPDMSWDFTPKRDFHLEALADIQRSLRSGAQQQAESVQAALVGHIRHLQEGLEEDQQLLVYCETGFERIQVRQVVLPNHHTVILDGVDDEGNTASLLVTLNNVKITCKVMRVPPPDKPYRIGFTAPPDE
jgi:hypothetical protein